MVIGASTVVEYWPLHQKVKGSNLAATGTGRDKRANFFIVLAIDGSTVVEHLPHHPKVEGSSPAATGMVRKNMQKSFIALVPVLW